MITVDDILAARPSLKARAQKAAFEAQKIEDQRRHEQEQDLIGCACEWLAETAGCTPAEIEDIEFVRGPYNSDGSVRQVVFKLDDIEFRMNFDKVGTPDEKLSVYINKGTTSTTWVQVHSLADIGKAVK